MGNLLASNNCLNFIRIVAAFQVMLGHMIEHLELPINNNILYLTYFLRGVPIFFVISGFLMWFSIGRSISYKEYLKKRFWRIYPELWVAVIVEICVLILLYHDWNVKSLLLFSFGQGTIFQFWTPGSLRRYGVGTPNGTLWTIGLMIQFYIIDWFFYKLMKNRKVNIWIMGFALSFLISGVGNYIFHNFIRNEIIGKLWLFYFGMFLAEFKDRLLPFLQKYWYALLAIAFVFFLTGWDFFFGYYLFWSLFMTAGLIGFAYRFTQLSISPDISYGIFLYHMTVVNVFVNFKWMGRWLYVLPVVLISIMLAYVSTVTVGRISLQIKSKL